MIRVIFGTSTSLKRFMTAGGETRISRGCGRMVPLVVVAVWDMTTTPGR